MSATIDFVFNSPDDLIETGGRLNSTLGVVLQPYAGHRNDLFTHFLGLELSLVACSLDDDRDLDFSRYRFMLSTRTAWSASDRRAYQLEATALAAYALLTVGAVQDGMLVYDVQRLLARYSRTAEGEVWDSVSHSVVSFPAHFELLRSRMSAGQ
jgi:hypothetical protein